MEWFYADESDNQISVDESQLVGLVASQTIKPATLVWNETMTDWKPCSEVRPDLFEGDETATPPPLSSTQVKRSLQPTGTTNTQVAPTDATAVVSLVLGILSILVCMPLGLPAVICGHIARKKARESDLPSSNGGLALGGLITGYVGIAIGIVVGIVYGAIIFAAIASGEFDV